MKKNRFIQLDGGPFGTRWSFVCRVGERPPSVQAAATILGAALSSSVDCSDERTDGLEEIVYFAENNFNANTIETYRVQ